MEFENEKKQEQSAESREGIQQGQENYQREMKPVRSPRPRIQRPVIQERPSFGPSRPAYNQDRPRYRQSHDEEGFRPEGFGEALQSSDREQGYRPRNNHSYGGGFNKPYHKPSQRSYSNNEGGYQQREGGYQPRQQRPSYGAPRPRFSTSEGGYQPRQQRPSYGGPRPRFSNNEGGYGQQRPYGQRGGYQPRQGGFRPRTKDYDPNAKYSAKKRIEYKEINYDPDEPVRLNRFLANSGICSRREADSFIEAGVVTVNGEVVTELGTKVLRTDDVRFHDQPVTLEKKVYVLLNKPKDYVTTSDDPQQRRTVMDLVKGACPERIYPVGRLDRNTTGVLLLTNDGDLASKLTHPKYLKKKIYHVHLDKAVTAHDMQQIAEGLNLEDGEIKADEVQYVDPTDKKQVGIEIHSGRNRIVRRIFESLGYRVLKLDRVLFAGLTKKNLRRGDWRYLTEEEVDRLRMGAYE
jgi:23S rRNA pseudouridine2605 synthase